MWMFLAIALALIGGLCLWGARSSAAMKETMDSMPTTPVEHLNGASGYVEIKGVVSCDTPLNIPHVEGQCVYYSYTVEQRERDHDGDGHTWRTIDRGSSETPFTLTDSSGSVTVDPEGADHDAPKVYEGYIDASIDLGEGLLGMLGKMASAAASRDRRVTVYAVTLDQDLYILGTARSRSDGSIVVGKGDKKFFISTKSEEQLSKSYGRSAIGLNVGAGVCFLGAFICFIKHFTAG